jgi:hypothetical protein
VGGPQLDTAVSRLAQYRPFAAAEAEGGGVFESLEAVRGAFSALWGLAIELDEISAARDLLIERAARASSATALR